MGATTIWERWNGIRPDSTFEPASMNSFNHYAYGAIGDWMYRVMAGLDTDEEGAGYKKIRIKPHVGGGFTHANASLDTRYGKLTSGWKVENGKLSLEVEIPANTTATVYIPAEKPEMVKESGKDLASLYKQGEIQMENGYAIIRLGSGKYKFSTDWKPDLVMSGPSSQK
jgi:alpha-L-rhamnosidase